MNHDDLINTIEWMNEHIANAFRIPSKFFTHVSMQLYHYPDGTKSSSRPNDGQILQVWDQHSGNATVWQWDDFLGMWDNITARRRAVPGLVPLKLPVSTNVVTGPGKIYLNEKLIGEFENCTITANSDMKCECGSEKCGSNKHSSWCQKYTP